MNSSPPIFVEEEYRSRISHQTDSRAWNSSPPASTWRDTNTTKHQLQSLEMNMKPFPFETKDLRYKDYEIEINARDLLPRLAVGSSILKKVQKITDKNFTKDLALFPTRRTEDAGSRVFHLEDLTFITEEAQSYGKWSTYLTYQTYCKDRDQERQLLEKLRAEITESSRHCTSAVSESVLQSDESGEGTAQTFDQTHKRKNNSVLRDSDHVFLNTLRIFLVLARTSPESEEPCFNLHKFIYFPNTSFHLAQIHQPFKLVSSPLTTYLTRKNINRALWSGNTQKSSTMSSGYMCLDKNLRMLPIMPSDPVCHAVPLVGVWMFGLSTKVTSEQSEEEQQFLLATLERYISSTTTRENQYCLSSVKKSFIAVLFSHDESTHFYEIELVDGHLRSGELTTNQWVLLKNTERLRDVDQMGYDPLSFYFNPSLVVKNLSSLGESLLTTPPHDSKSQYSLDLYPSQQSATCDSLAQYLGTDNSTTKGRYSYAHPSGNQRQNSSGKRDSPSEQEEDGCSYQWSLPQPQPQPHLRLEDSKHSHKTATFIYGNDQTFTPDAFQNSCGTFGGSFAGKSLLTDSIKGPQQRSNGKHKAPRGCDHRTSNKKTNQSTQSDSLHETIPERPSEQTISPFAEQLLQQQSLQLRVLQQQIVNMQNALLSCTSQGFLPLEMLQYLQTTGTDKGIVQPGWQQSAPLMGLSLAGGITEKEPFDRTTGKPPLHATCQGNGLPPTTTSSSNTSATQISTAARVMACKSTNTTFNLSKTDINEQGNHTSNTTGGNMDESSGNILAAKIAKDTLSNSLSNSNVLATQRSCSVSRNHPIKNVSTGTDCDLPAAARNDISRTSEQYVSDATSDGLHISLSKIQAKDTETEAEEKLMTEDEMLKQVASLQQKPRSEVNLPRSANQSIEREEERPLSLNNDSRQLNLSRQLNFSRQLDESRDYDAPAKPHNNIRQDPLIKPIEERLSSSRKRCKSMIHAIGNKENVDSNRKPALAPRHFVVEDSNDTMESLCKQVIKLRHPEEFTSSFKKGANQARTKLAGLPESNNQSLKIPRIKFEVKATSDSSDDDLKKIELKHLRRL